MKKLLLISLFSTLLFSSENELYTEVVIKLVKESKIMKKDINSNKHALFIFNKYKSKESKLSKLLTVNYLDKSKKEIANINKIDNFILANK